MAVKKDQVAKGQVAAEFMMYSAVFMFLVIAAYVVINQIQSVELPARQNSVAKETGQGFVNAISLSVKGSQGFSYRYIFPKTILGSPYSIDLSNMATRKVIYLTWAGNYGNASFAYDLPPYNYLIRGGCLESTNTLYSDQCSNILVLNNDGQNLTLEVSG